jgi:hypothetical protein
MDVYIVTKLHESPAYCYLGEVAALTKEEAEAEAIRLSSFGLDYEAYEVCRYDLREQDYCHFMARISVAVEGELFQA